MSRPTSAGLDGVDAAENASSHLRSVAFFGITSTERSTINSSSSGRLRVPSLVRTTVFAFQSIPLVLRPPNGEVAQDKRPADGEVSVSGNLCLSTDVLAVEAAFASPLQHCRSGLTRAAPRVSGDAVGRVCGPEERVVCHTRRSLTPLMTAQVTGAGWRRFSCSQHQPHRPPTDVRM